MSTEGLGRFEGLEHGSRVSVDSCGCRLGSRRKKNFQMRTIYYGKASIFGFPVNISSPYWDPSPSSKYLLGNSTEKSDVTSKCSP